VKNTFIDLSLDIYEGAPTFANDPECHVKAYHTIDSLGYNMTQLSMSTHQGTHLDAPFHFVRAGKTVEQLDLQKCIGEALLVDLSHKKPKEALRIEDFLPYQDEIVKGARVIYRTDWDRQFPQEHYFSDFPYMTLELAQWLASREIGMIGMDVPTPNPVDFDPVHQALLGAEIVIVEGLANLCQIQASRFFFMAAPLKIVGRDGSPVRALAMLEEGSR